MSNGRFFFWVGPPHWEIVTSSRTMAFGVLYLSRPSAAWPSTHASAIPACGHRARVQESCSRRQSLQRATRRGTKLQRHGQSRRPSPRVMKSLDPCRAAMVRRYAICGRATRPQWQLRRVCFARTRCAVHCIQKHVRSWTNNPADQQPSSHRQRSHRRST